MGLQELNRQLLLQRSNKSWAHGFRNVTVDDKFLACSACRAVVYGAEHIVRGPKNEWAGIDKELYVKRFFSDICSRFLILKQDVCNGLLREHWPIFEFILQSSRKVDVRAFCNKLGIKFCKTKPPIQNWVLTINDEVRHVNRLGAKMTKKSFKFEILHITDIHYDLDYRVSAIANCEEPLCCHLMSEIKSNATLAGYWGDYHVCDAPLRMIENAFDHMRRTHPTVEYIYHTGDVLPHAGWKLTKTDIIAVFAHMDKLMTEKFPGIPIFPCIGNNDVYPSDL